MNQFEVGVQDYENLQNVERYNIGIDIVWESHGGVLDKYRSFNMKISIKVLRRFEKIAFVQKIRTSAFSQNRTCPKNPDFSVFAKKDLVCIVLNRFMIPYIM